jgi:ribosomal protein S6
MTKTSIKQEPAELAIAEGQLYLLTLLVSDEKSLATVKEHLKDRVKIVKEENLGPRTLAYPINKHKELTLISIFFTADSTVVTAIEKELKLEEEVERFLLTTWRGDINKEPRSARKPRSDKEDA